MKYNNNLLKAKFKENNLHFAVEEANTTSTQQKVKSLQSQEDQDKKGTVQTSRQSKGIPTIVN